MSRESKGFGKFLLGLGIGAGLGVLLAPKKGEETREDVKDAFKDFARKVKNIDKEEVKYNLLEKVNSIEEELKDLDKEKALKLAKKKAEDIKDKAEELTEYAKEKATPYVEEAAENVRKEAIKATKKVLKKLEDK